MISDTAKHNKNNASDAITRLQRGILRLALSFHGHNTELDVKLQQLGSLLRSGDKDKQLQSLIDEIVDIIVAQDIPQNAEQRGGRTLCDLLDTIARQFPQSDRLSPFIDKLSLPLDRDELDGVMDDVAIAVAAMAREQAAGAEHTASDAGAIEPLVSHLLDRIPLADKALEEFNELKTRIRTRQNTVDLMTDLEQAAQIISNQLLRDSDVSEFGQAREHLLLLMNLIPFPATLSNCAASTRREIEQAQNAFALNECIPQIADLTAQMRVQLEAEISELGEFLKATLTRLKEFEEQIEKSQQFHDQSLQNTIDLEENLGSTTQEMRAEISDDADIDSIKNAVRSRLDTIDESLSEFVQVEDKRNKQARARINEMVDSLNELEFEAKELRDSLEKQHAQVLIDPLTGILNRSGYNESVNKEFVRWRRYNSDLSVAVIDLDLFKNINDSYGHTAGDKVLATVARQIESQIRECDILCRYGGEEFVLLLPETSVEDGALLMDKLREFIAQCKFHFQQTPVPVTFSCGIAGFRTNDTIESVFNRADQAMYLAKSDGRNQCRTDLELQQESA